MTRRLQSIRAAIAADPARAARVEREYQRMQPMKRERVPQSLVEEWYFSHPYKHKANRRQRAARKTNLARADYQRQCGEYLRRRRVFRLIQRVYGIPDHKPSYAQNRASERLWVYYSNLPQIGRRR